MRIGKEKLMRDIQDYYGTAVFGGMPAAFLDFLDVRDLSTDQLLQRARNYGFDLNKYKSDASKKRWK